MSGDIPSAMSQDTPVDCDAEWRSLDAGLREGSFGTPIAPAPETVRTLLHTVEAEIIPRLMMLHRRTTVDLADARSRRVEITESHVIEFCKHVLAGQEQAADFVSGLMNSGLSRERLYLDLLAPAARHFGELWDADLCDFTEVTLGLWRLQHLLQVYSGLPRKVDFEEKPTPHALLAAMPGEQHTFGLTMVAEFFRRAGWQVWDERLPKADEIVALVRRKHYDLLGVSIGSERHVDQLATLIRKSRKASLNPDLRVMIGGPLVFVMPDLAAQVGADGAAANAEQAILLAEASVAGRDRDR